VLFDGGVGERWPVYFDGRSVGYAVPGCDGGTVVVVDTVAGVRTRAPFGAGGCSVSLRHVPRRVRVNRRGELKLEFASRTGAEGNVTLYDPGEQRAVELYGGNPRGMAVDTGGRSTVELQLTDAEVKRLRSAGRLELELRVVVFQIGSAASVTRTVPLTLLPPA
jgi:hypothetical protein